MRKVKDDEAEALAGSMVIVAFGKQAGMFVGDDRIDIYNQARKEAEKLVEAGWHAPSEIEKLLREERLKTLREVEDRINARGHAKAKPLIAGDFDKGWAYGMDDALTEVHKMIRG